MIRIENFEAINSVELIEDLKVLKPTMILTPCDNAGKPYYDVSYLDENKTIMFYNGVQCYNRQFVTQAHVSLATLEKSNIAEINEVDIIVYTRKPESLYHIEKIYKRAEMLLKYNLHVLNIIN